MSRIGKQPIQIPAGVSVSVDGQRVTVKGPKGTLEKEMHQDMVVTVEDGHIQVERPSDEKEHKALHGLTRTLIANMVEGVTKGYEKQLEIVGVGYRATKQGSEINLAVGYSHPVQITPEDGIEFDVPKPTQIVVRGIDKELVGQTAANIRAIRPPEPYLGKGIRYANEYVRRKAGKAGRI
ncbi:MAG: 50S ribosomal protein L6 [Limnochordia bacterium]|nr:50S ribosomal protein L6 [Limnochordia bacterium]MDD2629744.1 50S ribosomal protein L6 [Limnochordia bacterium]